MKILLVNYNNVNDVRTQSELIFDDIKRVFDCETVDIARATKATTTGFNPAQMYRNNIIDRVIIMSDYIKKREELFGKFDAIISDDTCIAFSDIKTPIITVSEIPYFDISSHFFKAQAIGEEKMFEYGKLMMNLQKIQMSKSARIVPISNLMNDYVKRLGFESEYISPGTDTDFFVELPIEQKIQLRAKYGVPSDKKVGVTVQNFDPISGWSMMTEMVKKFKDIFWVIIIQANGKYTPKLPNVKILNNLNKDELQEVYNIADFYMSTEPVNGFDKFAVDAMSCNLPAIIPNSGLMSDVKIYHSGYEFLNGYSPTDFGICVDTQTPEVYSTAIEEVIKSTNGELYEFMPRKAVKFYRWNHDEFAGRWIALIDGLLRGDSRW